MTQAQWNARQWVLRFDELGHYLASKDSAKVVTSSVKVRPDAELIAQAIAQGKCKRYPKGMRTIHLGTQGAAKCRIDKSRRIPHIGDVATGPPWPIEESEYGYPSRP